jgi:hypothetical protein
VTRILPVLSLAIAMSLFCTATAQAQLIPGRPFRPLFRTASDPALNRDRIDVMAFASAGHDEVGRRIGDVSTRPQLSTSNFGSLYATGLYAHQGRRSRFSISGAATTRYYSVLQTLTPMNVSGAVRGSFPVGRRTNLAFSQRASYSPYYTFEPLTAAASSSDLESRDAEPQPIAEPDAATDHRTSSRTTYGYDTQALLESQVGRHSRFELSYSFHHVDTTGEASDFASHQPSVIYTHGLGRNLSLNVGYTLTRYEYLDTAARVLSHDIHGGLSFARQVFSRQTSVFAVTRTSIVNDGVSNRFYLGGTAGLSHRFTREWFGVASYTRGADVLEGFAAPFFTFSDAVSGRFTGRVVGPLRVAASGSFSRGSFSVQTLENSYQSRGATVRLWVPVTSMLAAYVDAYDFWYNFRRRVGLLESMPARSTTYGVRAGLTFWLPVLR